MPEKEIEFDPVDHITTDAIGAPGKRVFYLQAWKGSRTLTLLIEKFQVESMSLGVEQFLDDLANRFPLLDKAPSDFDEKKMHIQPPVDPLFRVGELGLSYDIDRDLVALIVKETVSGEKTPDDATVVRFHCTRAQLSAMVHWGMEVVRRGRPICPYCGEPEDPQGHFCPKKNGKHA